MDWVTPGEEKTHVALTPHQNSQVCPHELRPGTTVCIHCRYAARVAAREKRTRLLWRAGAFAIVIATIITAAALSASAVRERFSGRRATVSPKGPAATVAKSVDTTAAAQTVVPAAPADSQSTTSRRTPPLAPILPSGESPLSEGVTATRTDSVVVVSFDSPLVRTRRASKFESLVRATLPAIYGRGADSALARVPDGGLAGQGDLFADLPTRGMRIPAGDTWEIRLYPESRPGQDGPVVVRFRVSVVSTNSSE